MLNKRLISETIALVKEYYEINKLSFHYNSVEKETINWYSNTEIVDAEMLAAVVMTYSCTPENIAEMTWDKFLKLKEFYFPTIPFEYTEISVEELDLAMKDMLF